MGATFVVVLREGFEAALLVGIVYAYLAQIGHADSRRYVTVGAALAIAASVLMGVGVSMLSGPLMEIGPDVVALVVIFGAVALLTWHGWWMGRHARQLRGELQRQIDAAHASQQLWMVGLIAFTGVFREGAETVLFLWGLMTQLEDASGWAAVAGGSAGLAAAAALGWIVFQTGRRLSVQRFFAVTSVLILFLAAGLFSAGVGRLQGLGLVPGGEPVWDTSWLLDDRGGVGGFLAGLVGYRARPSALELAAYVLYLAGASVLFLPSVLRPGARADRRLVEPAQTSPRVSADAPTPDRVAAARPRVICTEELFGPKREVIIEHRGEEYRLRITRADKLILTK